LAAWSASPCTPSRRARRPAARCAALEIQGRPRHSFEASASKRCASVSAALSACSCAETEQSAGCRERWPARADLRHRGVRQGGRGGQGAARGRRRQGPGAGAAGAGPALRPEGYLPYPIPLPLLSARPCLPTRCVSSSCCSSAANPAHCGRAAPIARGRLAGPGSAACTPVAPGAAGSVLHASPGGSPSVALRSARPRAQRGWRRTRRCSPATRC